MSDENIHAQFFKRGWDAAKEDSKDEIDRLRAEISEKNSLITELRSEVERLQASNDFLRHCTQGFVFISEHGEMETWVCAECRGKNWREEHGDE